MTLTATAPPTAPTGAPTALPTGAPTGTARRARRPRVQRPPSSRVASLRLRRSAPMTTGQVWRRSSLPDAPRTSAGVPLSEAAASLFVVALLFVPVAVWTQFAPAVGVAAVAAVAVTAYLLWARRVVVGDSYVAVRQLLRYHVATVDHVRHLELRPSAHGGVLCLHTDDGRCRRLRRAEVARPEVNAALRELAGCCDGTRDPRVEHLLDLPNEPTRIRHRYLADALA